MKINQNGEFDQHKWLFENSQGTYGFGNGYNPQDDFDDDDGLQGGNFDLMEKPWKPLSRTTPIESRIMSPYRLYFLSL